MTEEIPYGKELVIKEQSFEEKLEESREDAKITVIHDFLPLLKLFLTASLDKPIIILF